jgi:hypothetical protein
MSTKITPATYEEAQAVVQAMDVNNEVDWDSTDHDKVVEREALVVLAKDGINIFRACVDLGIDRPIESQPQNDPAPAQVQWPAASDHQTLQEDGSAVATDDAERELEPTG